MGKGIGEYRKWRNWYQNWVDEEIHEVVPEIRKQRSVIFLDRMMSVAEQERVILRGR